LNLAIGLPLRNRPALGEFLRQIYDPASPMHRKYFTSEQFTQRFGPTEEDYQAVIEFARTNGLTIVAAHPNRMVLDVTASVTDIEKALRVNLRLYPHPREPRAFYAPDADPVTPAHAPILHISGLDNYLIPHPAALRQRPSHNGAGPVPLAGSGPAGAFRGNDFRGAYAQGVEQLHQLIGMAVNVADQVVHLLPLPAG
jgi:subtilase family serine protease